MHFIFVVLIFCLVLFFYLHIYFQLKTSNDLEIYEFENPSKERLEEICDLRQPVLFVFSSPKNNPIEQSLETNTQSSLLPSYSTFDVKVRKSKEESGTAESAATKDDAEMYIPLALNLASVALKEDKDAVYFSEKNSDFLEETGIVKSFRACDAFLAPAMTCTRIYDYLFAAKGTQTPFRQELNYRSFFMVIEGEVKVKMAPPKSKKYLLPVNDYEHLEFRSPLNPWNIQPDYSAAFDKFKCLEITLKKGQLFYLPAYWWYSFEFSSIIDYPATTLCSLKYRTYMNNIAISDKLFIHFLQSQNIKRKNMKIVDAK